MYRLMIRLFLIKIIIVSIDCQTSKSKFDDQNDVEKCFNRIYRECNHATSFTYEEIENVRLYIQNRFSTETRIKPVKPECSKLYVRKDFKCLTHEERMPVINVFKELYRNGVMDRFSAIHARYWPQAHKGSEAGLWHRWFLNEFEKEMRKIDPQITLPYWETTTDFAALQNSLIWDYFGHVGDENNGYCVSDGPFANQIVANGEPHCLRRQWNDNKTLTNWGSPEWDTATGQLSNSWLLLNVLVLNAHFKTHLSIGGYEGDMSIKVAPNDPLFYLFHGYQVDYQLFKWQFRESKNLVPESYNFGVKFVPNTNIITKSNLYRDYLTYYSNTSIIESLQIGFGDLCWVHDQHIKPINSLIKNEKIEVPIAIKRLPQNILKKFYPQFLSANYNIFTYVLPEVGDCNRNSMSKRCRRMPLMQSFLSTANGRRQLSHFKFDAGFDISPAVLFSETVYYYFMYEMSKSNYCSPYA